MAGFRVLVAEDDESFGSLLKTCLQELSQDTQIDIADDYAEALQKIRNDTYDLITVDLIIPHNFPYLGASNLAGMYLLEEIRQSENNAHCGVVVVTAHGSIARADEAHALYNVSRFIDKHEFDERKFKEIARKAILKARLERAANRDEKRYRMTISFNKDGLTNSNLIGPDLFAISANHLHRQFDVADLVRRADLLNWMIIEGSPDIWRPEARSIGRAIYEDLAIERWILALLTTAQALAHIFGDIWLEMCGPAEGLGIPFELLRDENKALALHYVLTRKLNGFTSRKPEPFHKFIEVLRDEQKELRVLIINPDDNSIPDARTEAESLKKSIESNLTSLGLDGRVDLPVGDDASYPAIRQILHDGNYHIIHYAGHGKRDDELPEKSGLKIKDKDGVHILTATDFNSLLRDKTTRMVFLSACLSASTASDAGRGDFRGLFEAIAEADVPIVAGYRWEVDDEQARLLAEHFYDQLWRTFSPGEAMLRARQMASRGEQGRDDETWASPVLLVQNN